MTYYEAALQVLASSKRPLSTKEIVERALDKGIIVSQGRTPQATMSAVLYRHLGLDPKLLKISTPGRGRAERGSVHWTLSR